MTLAANACLLVGAACVATLAVSDFRSFILPDPWVALLALAAVLFHLASGWVVITPVEALAGALVGSGLLFVLRAIFFRLRQVEAIGLGDVKLLFAAGLWVGIWQLPLLLLGAALLSLAGIGVMAWRAGPAVAVRTIRFPFGVSVCAALVALLSFDLLATRWAGHAEFGL